jgi:4-hydroxy-tetrahydrodipicolinate reductase
MNPKRINYGLIGSSGRLGNIVSSVFNENDHHMVFSFSLEEEKLYSHPELIIDCSLPGVFSKTVEFVKRFNSPLIIATTGLSAEQFEELKKLSRVVPVVQSYNFSIGIQVLLKLTQVAKETLKDWDVEITETHHRFKKDKPSGTAKMIRQLFSEREVNVSSLRLGNVPGDHTIKFGSLGEVISLSHSATSRRTFAEGILLSAEFIMKKKNGFFTFTDVVFPNS